MILTVDMKKRTSLKDIAQKVGVSTASVSYVLNNLEEEKGVGKEIAAKIRKAAQELNYTTNHIAKSLKTKKTNTIGFIVADIKYRFTSGVTSAVEAECQKYNLTVLIGISGEDNHRFSQLVSVMVDRQVDGLIIVPVENCEKDILYLNKHEIPFVLIDRILPDIEANIIAIDNSRAAFRATNQLIKTGHKRIGFISYQSKLLNLADRKNGYLLALAAAKIKANEKLIKEVSERNLADEVRTSIDQLLKLSPAVDSIFFATETLAVEGLRYINQLHIQVPQQLGIVSFDKSESFEMFYCPITHGSQPLEEIGRLAVTTLLDTIDHPKIRKRILLETDFITGKSCGE